jgi:AAA+ ATPase superfamily predicted ATPase
VREQEERQFDRFLDSEAPRPTLALLYGRRRIGKSTMLLRQVGQRQGFYFEATEVSASQHLERLGVELGAFLGTPRIALDSWREALAALMRIGERGRIPVVLDEFGYLLEADRSVPSEVASALGPAATTETKSRARVVLCGSAISVMRALTLGEAALRGRAGLELAMQADDFRVAATRLPNPDDLETAMHTFAVIGGVIGYATDMVDFDLPRSMEDFDRWVVDRVLSPAATLHHEATTVLAEEPTAAGKNALLSNSLLGAIANGSVTAADLARAVGRQAANVLPQLGRLGDAGFVVRHEDPIRSQRTRYALNDSFLQFHFAVLEPHRALLRDRDAEGSWANTLRDAYRTHVRGPVFEEMARTWVRRFASDDTLPTRDWIGPSSVSLDGREREIDVLVAAGVADAPAERRIVAIGEATSGEVLTVGHLRSLERKRAAFGNRAEGSKLLLFGPHVDGDLRRAAGGREDVELVDLDRLYRGS